MSEYDQYALQLENVMSHNRLEMKKFKTYFKLKFLIKIKKRDILHILQ